MKAIGGVALLSVMAAMAQNAGTTVRVQVINAEARTPIGGAIVIVASASQVVAGRVTGRTGEDGRFESQTPFSGSSLITVIQPGFRTPGGSMGKVVELKPGPVNEITIDMVALSVLSGRVVDQYGDPIRGVVVSAQTKRVDRRIGEYFQDAGNATTTNDIGEYRITRVSPGSYWVVAEYDDQLFSPGRRSGGSNFGGLVVYPGSVGLDGAQQVRTVPGQTLRLDDIRLPIRAAVLVRGQVRMAAKPAGRVEFTVRRKAPNLSRMQGPEVNIVEDGGGRFQKYLLPGRYTLQASDRSGRQSPEVTVEVDAEPVTGLTLTLGDASAIAGRIVVDGGDSIDFSKLHLSLGSGPIPLDRTGAFRAVTPGSRIAWALQGLPEGWYIKGFRLRGQDITGRILTVEPGESEAVLTLSPRAARVEVEVNMSPGGVTPVYAVLLPERGPLDVESVPNAAGNPATPGKFILTGLVPGDYRLFLLDVSNWSLLLRPEQLRSKYRDLAPLLSLKEGDRKSVKVGPQRLPVE